MHATTLFIKILLLSFVLFPGLGKEKTGKWENKRVRPNQLKNQRMTKKIIYTKNAPSPIGPYSQAVEAGGMLYVSGQIALDPATGQMAQGIESETRQVMHNLETILKEAGLEWNQVVKTTIFLKDMNDFGKV